MRSAIWAIALTMGLSTGLLAAEAKKPKKPGDGPGRVAWFDLTTTNLAQSKEFYARLFDWKFGPVKGTDLALEITSRGKAIGTLRKAEGTISAFNGVVYVEVADIRASSAKAKELGATVVEGFPFDLPDDVGAISLILDPSGHPLGMYSRTPLASAK